MSSITFDRKPGILEGILYCILWSRREKFFWVVGRFLAYWVASFIPIAFILKGKKKKQKRKKERGGFTPKVGNRFFFYPHKIWGQTWSPSIFRTFPYLTWLLVLFLRYFAFGFLIITAGMRKTTSIGRDAKNRDFHAEGGAS